MKIKLAILDSDVNYLSRLTSAFESKYAEKLEVYFFTNKEIAISSLQENRIDMLVASEFFEIDQSKIPNRCGFAYFVNSADIETLRGIKAICKFQKVDMIYKQILSIYSEKISNETGLKFGSGEGTKMITFTSASGGTGASSSAAACAKSLAATGKKVLYLNLEDFGDSDVFFSGEGQFNLSDVIYALKGKKASVALKLESFVKEDASGVFFYSGVKSAIDLMELKNEDLDFLLSNIKMVGTYEYVVFDINFSFDPLFINLYKQSDVVIFVSDGSEIANRKLVKTYNALEVYEQMKDISLLSKATIMYNKFSNKTGKILEDINVRTIGGVGKFEHATTNQVVDQLSRHEIFTKIF